MVGLGSGGIELLTARSAGPAYRVHPQAACIAARIAYRVTHGQLGAVDVGPRQTEGHGVELVRRAVYE